MLDETFACISFLRTFVGVEDHFEWRCGFVLILSEMILRKIPTRIPKPSSFSNNNKKSMCYPIRDRKRYRSNNFKYFYSKSIACSVNSNNNQIICVPFTFHTQKNKIETKAKQSSFFSHRIVAMNIKSFNFYNFIYAC